MSGPSFPRIDFKFCSPYYYTEKIENIQTRSPFRTVFRHFLRKA